MYQSERKQGGGAGNMGVGAAGVRRKGRVNVIKVHCLEFSKN